MCCIPVPILRFTLILAGISGICLGIAACVVGSNTMDDIEKGVSFATQNSEEGVKSAKTGVILFGVGVIIFGLLATIGGIVQNRFLLFVSNFFYVVIFIVFVTLFVSVELLKVYINDNF